MSNNDNNGNNGNNESVDIIDINDNNHSTDSNDDIVFMESATDYAIIREIYDGAHELFESELERALEMTCETIVIEPQRLGEETARWITIGSVLQNTALITGVGSLLSGIVWPDKPIPQCSLATISFMFNGIHALAWRKDPCSNYKVETDPKLLSAHSANVVTPPVVLTRRNSRFVKRYNLLQTAITLIAFAFSAFSALKFSKAFKFTIA